MLTTLPCRVNKVDGLGSSRFLVGDEPASMKELCLKLLLILCTGMENVSQNTLMEYLMMNSIFESLVYLLSNAGKLLGLRTK